LKRVQPYLGRIDRLPGYDYLSNPFAREGPAVSPQLGAFVRGALLSDAALRHVAGRAGSGVAPVRRRPAVPEPARPLPTTWP
jgi:hypothetical protein